MYLIYLPNCPQKRTVNVRCQSSDNPEVIEQVLTRYKNTYHNRRSDLPVEADRTDYINKMRKAYPFHPELIDMFRLKWGNDSHPTNSWCVALVGVYHQRPLESQRFIEWFTSIDTYFWCQLDQSAYIDEYNYQLDGKPVGNGDACWYHRNIKQCV